MMFSRRHVALQVKKMTMHDVRRMGENYSSVRGCGAGPMWVTVLYAGAGGCAAVTTQIRQ
jgi:hypothetical protein